MKYIYSNLHILIVWIRPLSLSPWSQQQENGRLEGLQFQANVASPTAGNLEVNEVVYVYATKTLHNQEKTTYMMHKS